MAHRKFTTSDGYTLYYLPDSSVWVDNPDEELRDMTFDGDQDGPWEVDTGLRIEGKVSDE